MRDDISLHEDCNKSYPCHEAFDGSDDEFVNMEFPISNNYYHIDYELQKYEDFLEKVAPDGVYCDDFDTG